MRARQAANARPTAQSVGAKIVFSERRKEFAPTFLRVFFTRVLSSPRLLSVIVEDMPDTISKDGEKEVLLQTVFLPTMAPSSGIVPSGDGIGNITNVQTIYMEYSLKRGHLALLAASVMWGLMSPLSKVVMSAGVVPPLGVTTLRILGATVLFWLIYPFSHRERVARRDLGLMALAAIFSVVANQVMFIRGVSMTSPVDATIITTLMPIMTMLLAAIVLREPISGRKLGGVLLGMTGALTLVLNSTSMGSGWQLSGGTQLMGDLFCLAAQLSYAVYLVLFQGLIRRYSPLTLMRWVFSFATLIVLPFSWDTLEGTTWRQIPSLHWAYLAFIVGGGTFLCYLLVPIGQRVLRPTVTAMYNYVQPITASIVAIVWGLDHFDVSKLVAVVCVFAGVALVNRSPQREPHKAKKEEFA